MFGWSYPPGVTGMEFAIAGPDREVEEEHECPRCHRVGIVLVAEYRHSRWANCPEAVTEHAVEPFRQTEMQRDPDGDPLLVDGRPVWVPGREFCLVCGQDVLSGEDVHPASGGCGEQWDLPPDPEWLAAELVMDRQQAEWEARQQA